MMMFFYNNDYDNLGDVNDNDGVDGNGNDIMTIAIKRCISDSIT